MRHSFFEELQLYQKEDCRIEDVNYEPGLEKDRFLY